MAGQYITAEKLQETFEKKKEKRKFKKVCQQQIIKVTCLGFT